MGILSFPPDNQCIVSFVISCSCCCRYGYLATGNQCWCRYMCNGYLATFHLELDNAVVKKSGQSYKKSLIVFGERMFVFLFSTSKI